MIASNSNLDLVYVVFGFARTAVYSQQPSIRSNVAFSQLQESKEGVFKKIKIGEHSGHLLGFDVMLYRPEVVSKWSRRGYRMIEIFCC